MGGDPTSELLDRLGSAGAGGAWTEFVDQYSPLIRRVIAHHEHDAGQAVECFDYVCGALSDDGFRRLRSFWPGGPARFQTWLMAVVSNLCCDWRRRRRGRNRHPRPISRLPELDQQVYHHIFVRGLSRAECVASLTPKFPELAEATVAEISARLFTLLTPQQRWSAGARRHAADPSPGGNLSGDGESGWQHADPRPGPDESVAEQQELRRLYEALARLPQEQRLLLRLRYEQGLTLAEVARLTRQPDPFRANRRIQAALDALALLMNGGPDRKNR